MVRLMALMSALLLLAVPAQVMAKPDHTSATFFAMETRATFTIVKTVNDNPDIYGGIYYDNATDEFVVQYATDEQPDLPAASSFDIRWEKVANSRTTLDAQLDAGKDAARAAGEDIFIDPATNSVVTQPAPDVLPVGQFTDPQGGTSCQDLYNCDPFRAGIGIGNADGTVVCTLGYMGYNDLDQLRMVTAGHCPVQTWYHGQYGELIGDGKATYIDSDYVDAQKVVANSLYSGASPHNYLYKKDTQKNLQITGYAHPYKGETIQLTGAGWAPEYHTGTVTSYSSQWLAWNPYRNGTVHYDYMWTTDADSEPGDSGGPVYITDGNGHATLLGTLSGANVNNHNALITDVIDDIAVTGVTPCTTGMCHQ